MKSMIDRCFSRKKKEKKPFSALERIKFGGRSKFRPKAEMAVFEAWAPVKSRTAPIDTFQFHTFSTFFASRRFRQKILKRVSLMIFWKTLLLQKPAISVVPKLFGNGQTNRRKYERTFRRTDGRTDTTPHIADWYRIIPNKRPPPIKRPSCF